MTQPANWRDYIPDLTRDQIATLEELEARGVDLALVAGLFMDANRSTR